MFSLSVAVLSALIRSNPLLLWILMIHGSAAVWFLLRLSRMFVQRAQHTQRNVSLQTSLDGFTAQWSASPRLGLLRLWHGLLGVINVGVLFVGTWFLLEPSSWIALVPPLLLSAVWTAVLMRWFHAQRSLATFSGQCTIQAQGAHIHITRHRWYKTQMLSLTTAHTAIHADPQGIQLTDPNHQITLPCANTRQRAAAVMMLKEMVATVQANPYTQSQIPEALAALRTGVPSS